MNLTTYIYFACKRCNNYIKNIDLNKGLICWECEPFTIIEKQLFICEWCKDRTYHKHKFFIE